jgi:hypothetical protein
MTEAEIPVTLDAPPPKATKIRPNPKNAQRPVVDFHKPHRNGNLLDHLPPANPSTAYKRYNPVLPSSSKLLSYRWDEVTLQKHKEKVKAMKACIDNHASLKTNPKQRSLKQQVSKNGKSHLVSYPR